MDIGIRTLIATAFGVIIGLIFNDNELDMGGSFDFFGDISHSDYDNLTKEQLNNRLYLKNVMIDSGFVPLREEWWHYTLKDEPYHYTYFTFQNRSI
ncbi:MAG: hypothetical protein J6O61_03210 [Butyrivibrio sp.]|uniref:M15 family metallopeptidase n=1 Tax=Butyrivibrio sp. TaxID=28121 RepID=UPI001B2E78F8|nr:M15 family metallopeptidase [Butyrivibrio sp.]MBO6239836.1 hypothetical protein [Butyrivibrio sp.]